MSLPDPICPQVEFKQAPNSPITSFLQRWCAEVKAAAPSYYTKEQVLAFMEGNGASADELERVRGLPPETRFWPDWN